MEGVGVLEHGQVRELFGSLVDHDLPPDDEQAVRSHLDQCPDCKKGFERYARAVELVRTVPREKAPVDFTQRVLKRVRKRRHGLFGWHGARVFDHLSIPAAGIVAVIIAAAAVVVFLYLR